MAAAHLTTVAHVVRIMEQVISAQHHLLSVHTSWVQSIDRPNGDIDIAAISKDIDKLKADIKEALDLQQKDLDALDPESNALDPKCSSRFKSALDMFADYVDDLHALWTSQEELLIECDQYFQAYANTTLRSIVDAKRIQDAISGRKADIDHHWIDVKVHGWNSEWERMLKRKISDCHNTQKGKLPKNSDNKVAGESTSGESTLGAKDGKWTAEDEDRLARYLASDDYLSERGRGGINWVGFASRKENHGHTTQEWKNFYRALRRVRIDALAEHYRRVQGEQMD